MLVERETLLAELLGFAAEGLDGRGRLVFLGGEAGVGKTSLTRALAAGLADRCVVRVGAVDNLTTADALAAFTDAMPDWDVSLDADRLALFRSLREQLRAAPSLLVLDDLHWADEATLDALRFLGRRLDGLPTLIVATYRHDEVSPRHPLTIVMGELAGLSQVHRRVVPPLTPAGVALLVEQSGAALDAADLYVRTEGNAFFVTEVLATGDAEVPATVRDAVLARVSRLSSGAADVAAAAAILGTAAPVDLLITVAGQPANAVDEAVERGVLVAGGDGLGFRHELARQAVEQSLSVVQRRRLHQAALSRLTALDPTDHRTLAHHALWAGEDALAVTHATAAARRASLLGAHREAVAQYQLALRAEPRGDVQLPSRAAVFEALAYECYLTDRIPESIAARQRALELYELAGDPASVGDTQRWLSRLSWFLGRNDDAERYAARAVATLEPIGETPPLAMAYSNLAQLRMLAGDAAGAELWGGRALALAAKLGDREVEIHSLNNVGAALSHTDRAAEGRLMLQRSLELALEDDAHEHVARAYTNQGSVAVVERRYADALGALDAGIAYCEERDLDSWTRYMESWRVVALGELGVWDEAMERAVRLLAYPDLDPVSAIPAAAAAGRIAARREEDAAPFVDLAARLAGPTGELQRIAPAACASAEAAWLAGAAESILALTGEALDLVATHPEPWVLGELLWWRSLAGVGTGDDPAAAAETAFAPMLAGRWPEAAQAWESLGCPLWQAYSLGLADDVASAQRAVGILERLGATAAIDAVLRTRREHGLALPRRPRKRTRDRIGQLTSREFDILLLLADGLSTADLADRLVLSPRTVEHHVSAVLHKLGEPTRARAVATARRLGVLEQPA
ncbi:MAG TPA: AAA family ATPase [Propionicimonas sp.]|uniref:ATP-binding protein n=1 Tax=Propionicimonas sp. TaxID=1955623 RepID=UPI002F42480A